MAEPVTIAFFDAKHLAASQQQSIAEAPDKAAERCS